MKKTFKTKLTAAIREVEPTRPTRTVEQEKKTEE